MSETNYGSPGNEGHARDAIHHGDRPYWKRAHLDWRMWVALFFMFTAITIYVLSENLALLPHRQPMPPAAGAVRQ